MAACIRQEPPVNALTDYFPLTPGVTTPHLTAPEPSGGCGWFDSSHDLRQGLLVQEHASLDSLSGAMSLSDWLAWHGVSNQVTP
jgi:hypothetical protein